MNSHSQSPVDPFKGKPPTEPLDYGSLGVNADSGPVPDIAQALTGQQAVYRLAFVGMEIPSLPQPVVVGDVTVTQHDGPIWTQSTYIKQRPGWIPHYDKTMHQGYLAVGEGLLLTLATLPVVIPAEHLAMSMSQWRDEVRAAVSILVALLDERLAQEELLEDLIVNPDDAVHKGSIDIGRHVRHFLPATRFLSWQRKTFDGLRDIPLTQDHPHLPAARWYLRAAQSGPTPDSIVFLWIALEALAPRVGKGKSRSDVRRVEDALREANAPVDELEPSVGRLANLRADIVHKGKEQPDLLNEGFYQLEILVRCLLRHRLGITEGTWPLNPGQSTIIPMLQPAEQEALRKTTVKIVQVNDNEIADVQRDQGNG